MIWDPAGLEIHTITPAETSSNELNVTLTLSGTGLKTSLTAILISHETREVIPCNNFDLTIGDEVGTVQICPNGKSGGDYDLVVWLAPPLTVVDGGGTEVRGIPVNATYILKKALYVAQKPKRTQA